MWTALAAKTLFEKARGLMFRAKAIPLLFDFGRDGSRANAIHSIFCPVFDAVFLNERKRVVCIMENVKPFQLLLYSQKPCRFLIELPQGESRKVKMGDSLRWG